MVWIVVFFLLFLFFKFLIWGQKPHESSELDEGLKNDATFDLDTLVFQPLPVFCSPLSLPFTFHGNIDLADPNAQFCSCDPDNKSSPPSSLYTN